MYYWNLAFLLKFALQGTFTLNRSIRIRTNDHSDFEMLKSLCLDSASERQLQKRVLDQSVLLAESGNRLLATVGIDLDLKEIKGLFIDLARAPGGLGTRLIAEAERLALRFGILDLEVIPLQAHTDLLHVCGYREKTKPEKTGASTSGKGGLVLHRSFTRRQTRYSRQISQLLSVLDIAQDYGRIHRIPLQEEATSLKTIGPDLYGREQQMLPPAANAWLHMKQQAALEAVELQAVSAFRAVSYQAGILHRKLDKGLSMEEILEVSAAPGYSEHHTGKAIDITTPNYPVLEEAFETSPAFQWLTDRAAEFGFHLSFPRGNRHKVAYEPWHWAWRNEISVKRP